MSSEIDELEKGYDDGLKVKFDYGYYLRLSFACRSIYFSAFRYGVNERIRRLDNE